ncbi:Gti1/Pac2 family-domain-containing protein [Limtongia smithiae]|uniref:Gti1/Pac2 family-domain-containing protein n=1 Tax=Limtongia smithiae TaxID=1125753 RepID=UPI0034CE0E47
MSSMETYCGLVRTPLDAIILFEACRLGILPRVQRRLSEKERMGIRSGSVFVWDEREAGMRRWTDGKSWSASRVSGSFLTYREMEGKRSGGTYGGPLVPSPPRRVSDCDEADRSDSDRGDDGPDGYRYKPDGLMKQSFSIHTSSHLKLHLISYFSRAHMQNGEDLVQPSQDPALKFVRIPKGMYPDASSSEPEAVGSQQLSQQQASILQGPPSQVIQHAQISTAYQQQSPMAARPLQYPQQQPHQLPSPVYSQPALQQQRQPQHYGARLHHQQQQEAPVLQFQQSPSSQTRPVHIRAPPAQGQSASSLPSILNPQQPQATPHQSVLHAASPRQQYGWPPSPVSTPPSYNVPSVQNLVQQQPPSQSQPQLFKQDPSALSHLSSIPTAPQTLLYPIESLQQRQLPARGQQQLLPPHMHTGSDRTPLSTSPFHNERLSTIARDLDVQDIPFEKVSWGEDTRAIDALNKNFVL